MIINLAEMAANAPGSGKRYDFRTVQEALSACELMQKKFNENGVVDVDVVHKEPRTLIYHIYSSQNAHKTPGAELARFTMYTKNGGGAIMVCNYGTSIARELFKDIAEYSIGLFGGVASKQIGG